MTGEPALPVILFACVHNAGRSQMAAAFARSMGRGRVRVLTGGSAPADAPNPRVVAAMAEVGIDISGVRPRRFEDADVGMADVVVTMGCGDACPWIPGRRYVDWALDDPARLDLGGVRRVRDEVRALVEGLLAELGVVSPGP